MKVKARLLVIDDDPAIRRMFTDLVGKKLGVDVVTAEDGAAGLELLRGEAFDVALGDYNRPGMSGLGGIEKAGGGKRGSGEEESGGGGGVIGERYRAEAIVGLTPKMQELHATIDRVRNE